MNNAYKNDDWINEREVLTRGLTSLGLEHFANTTNTLMEYVQMLAKWNKAYNLSAIRNPLDMVRLHLLDSLAILPHLNPRYTGATHWLDVGTGGGLPGMVMAICRPDWELVLLDSAGKKTRFLQQCVQALGLSNVEVIHARAQQVQFQQKADAVISRAFASLEDMTACTSHLIKPEGVFWAMKGQIPGDELSQVAKVYKVTQSLTLEVPGVEAERCLIALQPHL